MYFQTLMKWSARESVTDTNQASRLEQAAGTNLGRKDVRFVKSLFIGTASTVRVVITC